MKFLVVAGMALGAGWAGQAFAQDALDRTDPIQADEAREPSVAPEPVTPAVSIENPNIAAAVPAQGFDVGAIVVVGAQSIPISAFADIVERYSARTLDATAIARLTDEIAGRARLRGYIFASAMVEPQSLAAGVLRVRIDEGMVDRILIEGQEDAAVRSQLAALVSGQPVTLAQLEHRLSLADDVPGVVIRRSRYERIQGEGVLIVEMSRSRASGYLEFENDGSRPIGPERLRGDLDLNGVLSEYDELDLTVAVTPFEPDELKYARAGYRVLANGSGTTVGLTGSISATEPGAYLAGRDIFGRAWRAGLEVRHPLARSRSFGLWAEGEFEVSDLRQERADVLVRHDRVPALRVGLYSWGPLAGGTARGRVTFSQGLDILGATEPGDPLASRDDASASFSSLSGWAEWESGLTGDFSVQLAGRGKVSTDPLLSIEDLGLGGNRFLRGYNYSERTGDEGIMGSGELRYDWVKPAKLLRRMQLYAYADGGVVGNLEDGRGGGSLSSAGGGFRAEISRRFDFDFELAVPLSGPRYDTGDQSTRVNIRIRQSF